MDKFRDAYREALKAVSGPRMTAEKVQDELHHRRMLQQKYKRMTARGCTAAAVFLLCGGGVAAARNYGNSRIEVKDNGFVITGAQEGQEQAARGYTAESTQDMDSKMKAGGASSDLDMIPEAEEFGYELELVEYRSIAEFLEAGNTVAAIPDISLLGEDFTRERVIVSEDGRDVHVELCGEENCFFMHQADNRGYEAYSSATSYMGESSNERNFTNDQGFNYVMFDILDEEGAVESIHAVISVEGWDVTMDFHGFSEESVEEVLDALDLTVYYNVQ